MLQEPSSSSELAAVDFMSSDEEVHQPGAAVGTRFDSSEDEEGPSLAAQQHVGSVAASQPPAATSLSSLPDDSTGKDEEQARRSSDAEASVDRGVLHSKQLEQDMAGTAEAEGIREAFQEEADTREGASESSDALIDACSDEADAAAEVDGSPQGSAGPPEPLTSPSDCLEAGDHSEPSEPEEDALHVSAMDAGDDSDPPSPATQPPALQEAAPELRSEQEPPAVSQGEGGAPPEDQADQLRLQRESKTLEGVPIGPRSTVVPPHCHRLIFSCSGHDCIPKFLGAT